jgi:hypothetical protein
VWPLHAEKGFTSHRRAEPGVQLVNFDTPEGRVAVYLPEDARPGDTLSGTVSLEPSGRDAREQARNLGTLRGYVVAIGDRRASAQEPQWTWTVPEAVRSAVEVALLRDRGRPAARASVPLAPPIPLPPPVGEFALPEIGQTGRPIHIAGPFDGRFETGRLAVGGTEASPIVESARQAVFRSPADVVGPTEIRLEEGEETVTGIFRNVDLGLSAPRLDLRRGERTTLTVEVRGLEGLERPLEFDVVNDSPSVVSLEGGERQRVEIAPGEVGPSGVYAWNRTLTGAGVGAFDLRADLVLPGVEFQRGGAQPAKPIPCKCESFSMSLTNVDWKSEEKEVEDAKASGKDDKKKPKKDEQDEARKKVQRFTLTLTYSYMIVCEAKGTADCSAKIDVSTTWKPAAGAGAKPSKPLVEKGDPPQEEVKAPCGQSGGGSKPYVHTLDYSPGQAPADGTYEVSLKLTLKGCKKPEEFVDKVVVQIAGGKQNEADSDWDGDGILNGQEKEGRKLIPDRKK